MDSYFVLSYSFKRIQRRVFIANLEFVTSALGVDFFLNDYCLVDVCCCCRVSACLFLSVTMSSYHVTMVLCQVPLRDLNLSHRPCLR